MTFSDHAIRRFKKRILKKRTTSRKRVIAQMHKELGRDVQFRKEMQIREHYLLVTSTFQAVCFKHHVVTVLALDADAVNMTAHDLREEMKEVA